MRTAGFVLLCLLLSASPLMAHAVYWGGSNFNWFHSTYGQPQGECSFPPYGIINNYHLTYQGSAIRSLVQQDLQDMYNQGQRSLSIYLYHSDYALNLGCQPADFPNSRSTVIETHAWSSQDQTNMQDFFNDIQAARFERIRIGFIALQSNNPRGWTFTWDTAVPCGSEQMALWGGRCPTPNDLYLQNWTFIQRVKNYADFYAPSVTKYFDLCVECGDMWIDQNWGVPGPSAGESMRTHISRLWHDYTSSYGNSDTIGASATSGHCVPSNTNCTSQEIAWDDTANHLQTLLWIYDLYGIRPNVFATHTYANSGVEFTNADARLDSLGASTQPIIIGETFFNDAGVRDQLESAMHARSRSILFLTQWPAGADDLTQEVDSRFTPPIAFFNYHYNDGSGYIF